MPENHQEADISSKRNNAKGSLFKKSTMGKENQDFSVSYAESAIESPGKYFEASNTSLDLTATEALTNVKQTLFTKKRSFVNVETPLIGSDEPANESLGKTFEISDTLLDLTLNESLGNVKKNLFLNKKYAVNFQTSFNASDDGSKENEPETMLITENPPSNMLKGKLASNNIQNIIDWEQKFKEIVEKAEKRMNILNQPSPVKKKILPNGKNTKSSPKLRLKKPAPFATRRLYKFLIDKLEPKFGIDATIRAEELMVELCETVKIVTRRKTCQRKLLNNLKMNLANANIVETTWDFYCFIREFLPETFRNKSIPKIQVFTCEVWPPQDVADPFEKIL